MSLRVLREWALLPVALVTLLGAAGCGRSGPERPNLLLISIDTLRRDVMRDYGAESRFPWPVTPSLDDLSRRSVVLRNCYTVFPRTAPSLASVMTGLYPTMNGVYGALHALPESSNTLAEILSGQGYRTSAVVTSMFLLSGRGFQQGFETYDDNLFYRGLEFAENVVDRVDLLTLDDPQEPFFLWAHFLDPHWPYVPPRELLGQIHPEFAKDFNVYADLDSGLVTRGDIQFGDVLDQTANRHLQRRYLAECRHADGHIGRLLGMLGDRGYLDNTVVVVYSTQGESIGEHGYSFGHGENIYEPTVHVPAFIYFPTRLSAGRFDGLVSSPDLLPTILDLLGVPAPEELDGVSFLPAIETGGAGEREICYLESDYQLITPENPRFHGSGPGGKWRGLVTRDYKLIQIPEDGGAALELYDIRNDPEETRNLASEHPDIVESLKGNLEYWDSVVDRQVGEPPELSDEITAMLRALGYSQ